MTRYEPSTLIARWNSPNPQTTLPNLARALSTNLSATSTGRFLVSIRTLRLPPPPPAGKGKQQSKVEGRNMYIVRKLEGNGEETAIIVEDPNKPHRPTQSKGKGKAKNQDDEDDDIVIQGEGEGQQKETNHYRWSYSTVSAPPQTSTSSSISSASSSAIDSFIGRVLVAPPAPTSASTPQIQIAWQARPTALSLEGATFSISSNPISHPNNTDWLVKVAVVNVKGGTASGTTRGCIVQVSLYLVTVEFRPLITLIVTGHISTITLPPTLLLPHPRFPPSPLPFLGGSKRRNHNV